MFRRAALWLCVAILAGVGSPASAMTAIPSPKAPTPPLKTAGQLLWFVQLDGRWYDVLEGTPFIWFDFTGFRAFTMQAQNCRRSNGEALPWTPFAFYYGSFLYPLWSIQTPISYHLATPPTNIAWIEVHTIPGDVICNGEIPDPFQLGPDPSIFHDGFETPPPALMKDD